MLLDAVVFHSRRTCRLKAGRWRCSWSARQDIPAARKLSACGFRLGQKRQEWRVKAKELWREVGEGARSLLGDVNQKSQKPAGLQKSKQPAPRLTWTQD